MIDTASYKLRLEERQQELLARLDKIEDQLDDPHTADFGDQAIEREGDEVLVDLGQASTTELAQIKAALQRIEDKTYGICLKCGEEISSKRLEAVPQAALCKDCAR